MVRRKLIIPLVALATMALMLSATGASAVPHETLGTPTTECVVNGTVSLSDPDTGGGGLDNNRSNNAYSFRNTQLQCVGAKGGVFDVEADGETAGYFHKDPGDPTKSAVQFGGEDCDQGGSRKVDSDGDGVRDEVHSGTIEAFVPGTTTRVFNGKVHFVRLGTTVLADGPLWEDPRTQASGAPDNWFQAELEFVPAVGQDCVSTPVTQASLAGTGELYAGAAVHECNDDSNKVSDKDC